MNQISEGKAETIRQLNFLVKTDIALTKMGTSTQNRLKAINKECDPKFDHVLNGYTRGKSTVKGISQIKNRVRGQLDKHSVNWPVWNDWLRGVPGVGASTAGKLIILYYYRFTPVCAECGGDLEKQENKNGNGNSFVCADCGKKAAGDGCLTHRIDTKDFPTISKWWAYMGRHVVDGKMPKRSKGKQANWSTEGRTLGFHFADQCNRGNAGLYSEFLKHEREKIARKHPDISKGHNLNMAKNHTAKLFLSHFWTVARTLDGLPVSEPYVQKYMGHTNITEPFYFEMDLAKSA